MVSLCLTKAHIDGNVSVATTFSNRRSKVSSNAKSINHRQLHDDELKEKDKKEDSFLSPHRSMLSHSRSDQKHKKRKKLQRVLAGCAQPSKRTYYDQHDSMPQSFERNSELERRKNMLKAINAMGGDERSTRYYNELVHDARKDRYRVHKWRANSGRKLDAKVTSLMQRAVDKLQKRHQNENIKSIENVKRSAIPLPGIVQSSISTSERISDKKSHQRRQLDTVMEEKERLFRIRNNVLSCDDVIVEQPKKNASWINRLRHHLRDVNLTETLGLPDKEENNSSAENEKLNYKKNQKKSTNNLGHRDQDSAFTFAANIKLPPIITRERRRSFPMRRNTKGFVAARCRVKRLSMNLHETNSSIPENEATNECAGHAGTVDLRRSGGQKEMEPTTEVSPVITRTHSSNASEIVRSGSKNEKDAATPTDSEGSYGSSKYRRTRKMRGSRNLSKMESRNSPQLFRYFKPTRADVLMGRWYIAVKLTIWLRRLCESHRIVVDDGYNIHSGSNVSTEARGIESKKEVLFDLTDYKMKNQLRLSDTTRRILCLPSDKRTGKDVNLVQTALRNIKAIADYSTNVQTQVGRHGYFVGFEGKRVVVREGKRPLNYYILMAGSAVVIKSDESGNTNPVLFMKRGDVFGEHEILEDVTWQWSVVTSGYCEFLLLERDVYRKIFITGGGGGGGLLNDPDRGGFLRSISLLQHWPTSLLNENPNKCLFRYFKRGALLVNDHTSSEWIYVIKSGSCSVLKKLMVENLTDAQVLHRTRAEQTYYSDVKSTPHLIEKTESSDKQDHLKLLSKREENERSKDVSVYQQLEMSSILKELNPDVIGNSASPRAEADYNDFRSEIPLSSHEAEIKHRSNADAATRNAPTHDNISNYVHDDVTIGYRMSRHSDRHPPRTPSPMKAAYLRTGVGSRMTDREFDERNNQTEPTNNLPEVIVTDADARVVRKNDVVSSQKQVHINEFLFGYSSPDDVEEEQDKRDNFHSVHINVRKLVKGDMFGMGTTLYTDQPNLALVSNGSECLMLNKKFYLDNASEDCLQRLRESEFPFPSDDELMQQHWRMTSWNAYQAKISREFYERKKMFLEYVGRNKIDVIS